jgi:putative transposase
MKASKFSDAQKAFILKQGNDGVPVADICRKAGLSPATYFNWKKKYDGVLPPDMRPLKQLEDENGKLKKIVADLSLDREILQDVIRARGRCSGTPSLKIEINSAPGVQSRKTSLKRSPPKTSSAALLNILRSFLS